MDESKQTPLPMPQPQIATRAEISTSSTSSFPVFVYITGDDDLRASEIIRAILKGFGIESQQRYATQSFVSKLHKELMVGFVTFPRVFFRGRHIGGVNELQHLKDTGQLKDLVVYGLPVVGYGVCRDCGGYKFVLADVDTLMTCMACHGSGFKSDLSLGRSLSSGGQNRLYICFEAQDDQLRHLYIICTLNPHDPLAYQNAKIEAVIPGYPSMGCGVYDSKIVLAGGQRSLDHSRHNGCITFDMTDNSINHKPFLPMTYGKYKPLVFQLGKRLYVCDSKYDDACTNKASIEVYSPALKTRWRTMSSSFKWPYGSNDLLTNYACVVFGNNCLLSVPNENDTWKTHCNYRNTTWSPHSDASLPFTGVATFYAQDGFDDFVMIYLDKGVVRVCKFDLSCFGESHNLFTVADFGDEDMQGYFADFGKGLFCLTAFDNGTVYASTFVVTREGTPSDPLKVTFRMQSKSMSHFNMFCLEGWKLTSVVGCSVPAPNEEAKLCAEKAAAIYYKNRRKINDDYDPWDMDTMDDIGSLILEDIVWWDNEEAEEVEEDEEDKEDKEDEEDLASDQ